MSEKPTKGKMPGPLDKNKPGGKAPGPIDKNNPRGKAPGPIDIARKKDRPTKKDH